MNVFWQWTNWAPAVRSHPNPMKNSGTLRDLARRAAFALMVAGVVGPVGGEIVHTVPSPPVYFGPLPVSQDLDINGDGVVDFTLTSDGNASNLVPRAENAVISILDIPPDIGAYVVPLAGGSAVSASFPPPYIWYDANSDPAGQATIMACMDIRCLGFWAYVNGYAGLKLVAGGRAYYGWLHIENIGINAGQILDWAYETRADTPILIGATAGAPPLESVGLPDRFVCTLAASTSNNMFFVGAGGFQVDCTLLRFVLNVADPFTHIEAALLTTSSREVRMDLGPGQPVVAPLFAPVQGIGQATSAAAPVDLDFLYPAHQYSGQVPLTETLLRELQAGDAGLTLYLPTAAANPLAFLPVNQPDFEARGFLLALLQPGATNPAPCWPRAPRSTTVRYTPGPAVGFYWRPFFALGLDLDGDDQPDFSLGGGTLCTDSIPACCTTWYGVSAVSSNELLVLGSKLAVVEIGTSLGPAPPPDSAWSAAGGILTECGFGCDYRPWSGELGRRGEGYLGARLRRADGDHYGWMRVVLAGSSASPFPALSFHGPVVVDWAFEPQPGVATVAGARPYPAAVAISGIKRPGYLRTRVATQPGWSYAVQQRSSIAQGNWQSAGLNFVGDSFETLLDLPITGAAGFYRVVEAE